MIVKICGLKNKEDLKLAKELGANVVGMICGVPESPRNNSIEECKALFDSVTGIKRAVLFRNNSQAEVLNVLKEISFEILHLCGSEDAEFRVSIKKEFPDIKIWQSIGVPLENPDSEEWVQSVKNALKDSTIETVVLDSQKSGKTGGTGKAFPFSVVAEKLGFLQKEVIIAGGLKEELLEELFENLSPMGLDISSGIEKSPGVKSSEKMKSFFKKLPN